MSDTLIETRLLRNIFTDAVSKATKEFQSRGMFVVATNHTEDTVEVTVQKGGTQRVYTVTFQMG